MKIDQTKRIVIKVGSSLLFDEEKNQLNSDWLFTLAEDIKYLNMQIPQIFLLKNLILN